jgi:ribosomal protein S18 acetylase RimI-like enzyme
MLEIVEARTPEQIAEIKSLFLEYAQSLGFSLCFQSFEKELAELPGMYAPPDGRLLLALVDGAPAGCVGLHKLDDGICEMKRLYARPSFRGHGLGRALTERVIAEARTIGYERMRLDTVAAHMQAAVALYRTLGFRQIAPYRANPQPSVLYMELNLSTAAATRG